jgi:CheY-like chemotaxis protein
MTRQNNQKTVVQEQPSGTSKLAPLEASMRKPKSENHLLVVEDSVDDAFFITRAFQRSPDYGTCSVCRTAGEARDYMSGAGIYADRKRHPLPTGILTDMHLGRDSGVDFMKWVRTHPAFKEVPVVVWTNSSAPREQEKALSDGAAKVLRKPVLLKDFRTMLQSILNEPLENSGSCRSQF